MHFKIIFKVDTGLAMRSNKILVGWLTNLADAEFAKMIGIAESAKGKNY